MIDISLWRSSIQCATGCRIRNNNKLIEILEIIVEKLNILPIPTIDELRLFIGRGAVRLPPLGNSCVRRCGVRGTSHLQSNNIIELNCQL